MNVESIEAGTLIKIVKPGYDLLTPVGEFVCYWKPQYLGEKAKTREWVMIQFPGYAAERAFNKDQCTEPTKYEIKEYFAAKLKYGD